jgi:hypothetical protein
VSGPGGDGDGDPSTPPAGDGDGDGDGQDTAGLPPGCPDTTNHVGGTRVQLEMLLTAEGYRSYRRLFDVERGAPCAFNTAADGELRCLPVNWSGSDTYYLDASCTMPVYTEALQGPCEPAGLLRVDSEGTDCMTRTMRIFELGAEVTPTSTLYARTGDQCNQTSSPDAPLYEAGAEVPASSFPRGEYHDGEPADRLATTGVTTEGSAFWVSGWIDTGLDGERCYMQPAEEGGQRCTPSGGRLDRGSSTRYADASCETPLYAHGMSSCGQPPTHVTEYPDRWCTADPVHSWRVESAHAGDVFAEATSCELDAPPDDATLYGLTEVPPGELVHVEHRTIETDTGRLQRRHLVTEGGGCWADTPMDRELGVPCRFYKTTEDRWRCLPAPSLETRVGFSDSDCTTPVAYAAVPTCAVARELPMFVTTIDYQECRRASAYAVGDVAASTAELYYEREGDCFSWMLEEDRTWHLLTPAELEQFVEAEPE